MSPKSQKRKKVLADKKARKRTEAYKRGSGNSRYARKAKWLHTHELWGWMVPEPKPWK